MRKKIIKKADVNICAGFGKTKTTNTAERQTFCTKIHYNAYARIWCK